MTKEEILELASKEAPHCITVYIPTHQKGHEIKEGYDRLQFKNKLKEAEEKLIRKGLLPKEIESLLRPANELLDDSNFWTTQSKGLGVFIAEGFFKTVPLNFTPEPITIVNGRMHIKELIRDMDTTKMYYILRLSKKHPTLYSVINGRATQIVIDTMPRDLSEITKYYDVEEEVQGHSRTESSHAYHTSAPLENREQLFILEYFRKIDESIRPAINRGGSYPPLVLMGDKYMHAIYREANTYPNLIAGQFTGNFDKHSDKEIVEEVHPAISLRASESNNRVFETIKDDSSSTVSEIADVMEAAYEGRIDTLLVGKGHRFGEFDKENYKVRTNRGDECLYNEAAFYTLKNGGSVLVSDTETLLDTDKQITAILR